MRSYRARLETVTAELQAVSVRTGPRFSERAAALLADLAADVRDAFTPTLPMIPASEQGEVINRVSSPKEHIAYEDSSESPAYGKLPSPSFDVESTLRMFRERKAEKEAMFADVLRSSKAESESILRMFRERKAEEEAFFAALTNRSKSGALTYGTTQGHSPQVEKTEPPDYGLGSHVAPTPDLPAVEPYVEPSYRYPLQDASESRRRDESVRKMVPRASVPPPYEPFDVTPLPSYEPVMTPLPPQVTYEPFEVAPLPPPVVLNPPSSTDPSVERVREIAREAFRTSERVKKLMWENS